MRIVAEAFFGLVLCASPVQAEPPNPRKEGGETLAKAQQMQAAVLLREDVKEAKRILDSGFDIDTPIGCGTFSVVDGAVAAQNLEMLQFFLDAGARPQGSALLAAARCRDLNAGAKMVEALLAKGADPNYKEHHFIGAEKRFAMPLHAACFQGNTRAVELLLKQPGIEASAPDVDKRTPLAWALERKHEAIVRLLLRHEERMRSAASAK